MTVDIDYFKNINVLTITAPVMWQELTRSRLRAVKAFN